MKISQDWWLIDSHPDWTVVEDEECLTLTRSEDGGAFQLSSFCKDAGEATREDLLWFADQVSGRWDAPRDVTFGAFSGLSIRQASETAYSCWWFLAHGSLLVSASYHGTPATGLSELSQVEAMLATLEAA